MLYIQREILPCGIGEICRLELDCVLFQKHAFEFRYHNVLFRFYMIQAGMVWRASCMVSPMGGIEEIFPAFLILIRDQRVSSVSFLSDIQQLDS